MSRLPLDDPRWNELTNAYGPAGDIPVLLRELEKPSESWAWDDEPMYSLWSSLWHQGDVYTASYAAVPYLLDAVGMAPPEGQATLINLAASIIATSEAKKSPEPDASAAAQFVEERDRLYELASSALASLKPETDEQTLTLYLGAIAVAKGHARLGNFLMQVGEEWECEECGTPFRGYNLEN